MLKSCTIRNSDESDESVFRFTFYCDICGEPYCASPVGFADFIPPDEYESECWRLLWRSEHGKAFARANFEASHNFFSCPGCGLHVCKKCTAADTDGNGAIRVLRCLECERRINRESLKSHLRYVYEPQSVSLQTISKRRRCLCRKRDSPA